ENEGTDEDKKFAWLECLKTKAGKEIWLTDMADGKITHTPLDSKRWARYGYVSVWCTDWDDDGDVDLVASCQLYWLWMIENTGTRENPILAEPKKLEIGGKVYHSAPRLRPVMDDLDGDGQIELIHADPNWYLTMHRGPAAKGGPKFGEPQFLLDTKGNKIRLGSPDKPPPLVKTEADITWNCTPRCTLDVCDWDSDGRWDILVGTVLWSSPFPDCEILWYKNVGSNSEPVFELKRVTLDGGKPFLQPDS
ncbi:unnamed protein product, partial [marine sediment metagenome]